MGDLDIMSQGQMVFQQSQAQNKFENLAKGLEGGENNFAALTAKQLQDPSQTKAMQMRKIKETAVEFEAQFLGQMLQPMFEGIEVEEPFGGGAGEKMWKSMLVTEYANAIAKSGGIGLADHVQKQLLRAQEGL